MSFFNPFTLFAALGIGLPILAHLLARQKVKRTDWAAMQFLNKNVRVRSREIRLRDVVLLIMRCLAILLLVLAFSRPSWEESAPEWLPGESRAGVVIGLDASMSMAHGAEGESRFERALEQVEVIAKTLQSGDPVSLVLLGGEDEVLIRNMAYDRKRFQSRLQDVVAAPVGLNLDRVPGRLKELAGDMEAARKLSLIHI